jgi:hypothetical protein
MQDYKNAEQIIQESKTALLMTGELTEFQLTNLKNWPMIVFNDLEKVILKYDFQLDGASKDANALGLCAGTIEYNLIFAPKTKISKEKKEEGLTLLTQWTKFLFWNDTQVIFKKGGKKWK